LFTKHNKGKGEPRFKLLCLHTATKAKQCTILLQRGCV